MRYISKLFILVAMTAVAQTATAQPPARRAEAERNSNTATVANIELSERASPTLHFKLASLSITISRKVNKHKLFVK